MGWHRHRTLVGTHRPAGDKVHPTNIQPRYPYALTRAAYTARHRASSRLVPTAHGRRMVPRSPCPAALPAAAQTGAPAVTGAFSDTLSINYISFFVFFQSPFTLCSMPNLTELWLLPSMQNPLKYTYIHASKYICLYVTIRFCVAQQTDLAPRSHTVAGFDAGGDASVCCRG